MASAWNPNGPVSAPPKPLAYGAAVVLFLLAVAGVGLGLQAAYRQAGAPSAAGEPSAAAETDTLTAKPIVELPAPVAAADNATNATDTSDDADAQAKADALAQKTAAAQALQSKTAKGGGNIDDILASPSEKPAAPAKTGADEAPPGAPVKSDVPF